MRLVVFGASGRTGKLIVAGALGRGYEVTAFVRSPERLGELVSREGVTVAAGDACDPEAVRAALAGADVAVSALGATDRGDPKELSETTRVLIDEMERGGPKRLVAMLSAMALMTKVRPEFEAIAAQHKANFEALKASGLEWVAVCPSGLTDDPPTGEVRTEIGKRAPNWTISRADAASFVLDQIGSDEFLRQAVGVSD